MVDTSAFYRFTILVSDLIINNAFYIAVALIGMCATVYVGKNFRGKK